MISGWGYRGDSSTHLWLAGPLATENIFQINNNIGKIYIIECMIYLSKYINNTAVNIKINLYISQNMYMMLSVIDININLYICQKHVMILTTVDIKSTQSMTISHIEYALDCRKII